MRNVAGPVWQRRMRIQRHREPALWEIHFINVDLQTETGEVEAEESAERLIGVGGGVTLTLRDGSAAVSVSRVSQGAGSIAPQNPFAPPPALCEQEFTNIRTRTMIQI